MVVEVEEVLGVLKVEEVQKKIRMRLKALRKSLFRRFKVLIDQSRQEGRSPKVEKVQEVKQIKVLEGARCFSRSRRPQRSRL